MSRDVLPKLATEATLSILDKLERKMSRRRSVRAGIRFSLCILAEDMDNIIKIVDSLENSCLSIDGATKLVKYEIKKKQESGFLGAMIAPMATSLIAPMASSLIQLVPSSLIKAITRKGVIIAGTREKGSQEQEEDIITCII